MSILIGGYERYKCVDKALDIYFYMLSGRWTTINEISMITGVHRKTVWRLLRVIEKKVVMDIIDDIPGGEGRYRINKEWLGRGRR